MYTDVYGNVCLTIPSGKHMVLSGLGDHEPLVHTLIISPYRIETIPLFIASDIDNVRPPYSTINTLTGVNNRLIISTIVGCSTAKSG